MSKTMNLGLLKSDFSTENGKLILIRESMNHMMGEYNDNSNVDIIDEAWEKLRNDIRDVVNNIVLTNQKLENIDGGYFSWEDEQNETGSIGTSVALKIHMEDPDAHQNIILDGNNS